VPSWARQIVQGKTYSTEASDGIALWEQVAARLQSSLLIPEMERFGTPVLLRSRLGQGAFRLLVTDTYGRRCAVTRERTLPALDAAHVRPYAEGWIELFPAEQARIVQLLVERVDVQQDSLEVRIRADGLASLVGELRQQGERIAA